MNGPMIALDDVTLTFGATRRVVNALDGADLRVASGEAVAVLGPSGSGKSSLLAIIAGLQSATSGTVEVDGHDLKTMDEDGRAAWRRDRVGILFQSFHLIPTLTALENVAVPLELAGRRDADAAAKEALTVVGLAERLTHRPGELSGGEQQRVAFARALVRQPALLLADEPTGNLDTGNATAVADMLFDLPRATGTTVLLITHDPDLAARADRVLRMHAGKVVSDRAGTDKRTTAERHEAAAKEAAE